MKSERNDDGGVERGRPLPVVFGQALLLAALLACGGNKTEAQTAAAVQAAKAAGAARIEGIRKRYALLRAYPSCDQPRPASARCGLIAYAFWSEASVARVVETECDPNAIAELCWIRLRQRWYEALVDAYPGEHPLYMICTPDNGCPDAVTEEGQWIAAYNQLIDQHENAEITAAESDQLHEVQAIQAQAAAEERARAQAVGDAFRAASATFAQAYGAQAASRGGAQTSTAGGCGSDFDCPFGQKCAKDSLATRGTCARAVNQLGVPHPTGPAPESFQPGTGQCANNAECPRGFSCRRTSGGLYGNCMR